MTNPPLTEREIKGTIRAINGWMRRRLITLDEDTKESSFDYPFGDPRKDVAFAIVKKFAEGSCRSYEAEIILEFISNSLQSDKESHSTDK